ncbi:hypothetical protein N0V88_006249 [Collariella sp. IMI 366227]|nr:hypothetical protein N0V88_006249 [Collariella sp. IMI 366227]
MAEEKSYNLGVRKIKPGDIIALTYSERKWVTARTKYLVNDDLEVPEHIYRAFQAAQEGKFGDAGWNASEKEICDFLESLPKPLFRSEYFKRSSKSPAESPLGPLDKFMERIHREEFAFYDVSSQTSGSRHFLRPLQKEHENPKMVSAFHQSLKQADVKIYKIIHFTRQTIFGREADGRYTGPSHIPKWRNLFLMDIARSLTKLQRLKLHDIPFKTFEIPTEDDRGVPTIKAKLRDKENLTPYDPEAYIKEGILKIDKHTLVVDSTLNNSVFQVIQEANLQPGAIFKEFTYWHDGADQDVKSVESIFWGDYGPTHWLSQFYDVYHRHPGSGFVTCDPTIYIRKKKPIERKWPRH